MFKYNSNKKRDIFFSPQRHVGTSCARSDFLFHKKSITCSTVPPFPQKVPLRLRRSLVNALATLRLATNFLRVQVYLKTFCRHLFCDLFTTGRQAHSIGFGVIFYSYGETKLWHIFCHVITRRRKRTSLRLIFLSMTENKQSSRSFVPSFSQKITLNSPIWSRRLFKSPTPIATARCRPQIFASLRALNLLSYPRNVKNIFFTRLRQHDTEFKHHDLNVIF